MTSMTLGVAVLALLLGMLAHTLKQLITSRVTPGVPITLRQYFLTSWQETLFAVLCSIGLFIGYPEVPQWFPALGAFLTLPSYPTPLGGFLCGFIGNSLADILGGRLTKVVNG